MERLEERDCPAAPVLSISLVYGPQQTITLVGQVADENPATSVVHFAGQLAGSVVPDADGTFSFTGQASGLGLITAQANDDEGLASNLADVMVTSAPPQIVDFRGVRMNENTWVFSGRVIDEYPAGLTVRLTGLQAFGPNGILVQCNQDGFFFVEVQLAPIDYFQEASAQLTDWWGLESDLASFFVNPA